MHAPLLLASHMLIGFVLGKGFWHGVTDLEVILVFNFYDVDAVPASLLSDVASATSSQSTFLKHVNNEDVREGVLLTCVTVLTPGASGISAPHWHLYCPAPA